MWGKHSISQLEITEKFCYHPPPTEPGIGVGRTRKIFATTSPSPTDSRRLSEITETFCYYTPPLNRIGFWRSRKRLKKFNKLNLTALVDVSICPGIRDARHQSFSASTQPSQTRHARPKRTDFFARKPDSFLFTSHL